MSLKYKLPLIIFSLLITYMLIILFFMQKTEKEFHQIIENSDVTKEHEMIMKAISNTKDIDMMLASLKGITEKYDMGIIVYDENGTNIYRASHKKSEGNYNKTESYIINKGTGIYNIVIEYPIFLNIITPNKLTQQLKYVILIGLFILFILISLINYIIILHPLNKIRSSIQTMHYGKMLTKIDYDKTDEIGVLCRRLEKMGERLEVSYIQQNDIFVDISKDINIPLKTITEYIKELSMNDLPPLESKKYLNIIYKKAWDIENLLSNLEEYFNTRAKSENKKSVIDHSD